MLYSKIIIWIKCNCHCMRTTCWEVRNDVCLCKVFWLPGNSWVVNTKLSSCLGSSSEVSSLTFVVELFRRILKEEVVRGSSQYQVTSKEEEEKVEEERRWMTKKKKKFLKRAGHGRRGISSEVSEESSSVVKWPSRSYRIKEGESSRKRCFLLKREQERCGGEWGQWWLQQIEILADGRNLAKTALPYIINWVVPHLSY